MKLATRVCRQAPKARFATTETLAVSAFCYFVELKVICILVGFIAVG